MTKDNDRYKNLVEVVSYLVAKEKYKSNWTIKYIFSNEDERTFLMREWVDVKNAVMPMGVDMNNNEGTPIIPIVEQIVKKTLLDIEKEEEEE